MWKLKLDEAGKPMLDANGHAIYIQDGTNKEQAFDVTGTLSSLGRLRDEAKQHREAKEKAETTLAAYAGVDPETVKTALAFAADAKNKKLVESGEVDKVRDEITKAFQPKVTAAEARAAALQEKLNGRIRGDAFRDSKFIKDKIAEHVPADMVQAQFGQRFRIEENGALVGLDVNGKEIYSNANPGNVADFDEALSIMIDQYGGRDKILKPTNKPGTGTPTGGAGGGGATQLTRPQFEALTPVARADHFAKGGKVVDA